MGSSSTNFILEEMIFDTIKCNETYYLKICLPSLITNVVTFSFVLPFVWGRVRGGWMNVSFENTTACDLSLEKSEELMHSTILVLLDLADDR